MPPKKAGLGSLAPSLGCLIVALPTAMAITLQTIITKATFGDQVTVAGAMANRGVSMRANELHLIIRAERDRVRSS